MTITIADITDAWWKKHAPPKNSILDFGTGIGEDLRKYEKSIAALKASKILIPPSAMASGDKAALKNLPNRAAMAKEAAQAWKSLLEVEKKLEKLKKAGQLTGTLSEWGAVIYHHKGEMMGLADHLK
ncbi:hypothetical protein [Falsiroseomonas oryzae]|uniref:hypothetical protein n=1 Tax=Falsiroseomonas oryzae TaxID=2766473 RepID=UPI0022EB8175|nr:hypothetical protein [Roseomonas sp. MO-31]